MLFLGIFWKIFTYWPPLDERVRSSFAEINYKLVSSYFRVIIFGLFSSYYLQYLINFHGFYKQKNKPLY